VYPGAGSGQRVDIFYSKAFCHKEKLINFAFRKKCCTTSLYNIKTMGYIIACDNTNDKNT
jgi:hypothetical protein